MSESVIQVEKLSKRFTIGERESYATFRDAIARTLTAPFRPSANSNGCDDAETLWALRDVSFDVKQGEVVGLIGRNGAGKSTLLKILARITRPTTGWARVRGRIGSLLEVGTGFHPELTGRENVFLSGAILGMKKAEIQKKFGEIVAFSEVERFLDTPLKRYSSGMQMRLAFAVAAHLEPEILLVDEVLTVGDIAFQKKCLGKMGEVARHGRTIVFISHQMNQIRRLCTRCIWLEAGQARASGSVAQVSAAYEAVVLGGSNGSQGRLNGLGVNARFLSWEVLEPRSSDPNQYNSFGILKVRFMLRVDQLIECGHHGIALYNAERQLMWGTACDDLRLVPGTYALVYELPGLPLRPGAFAWRVTLFDRGSLIDDWDCQPNLVVGTPPVTHKRDEWAGMLNIPYELSVGKHES